MDGSKVAFKGNPPSREELVAYLNERNNSGRWGPDDQLGTLNLITPEKRLAALRQVKTGEVMSLSRPVPTEAGPGNPNRAHHYMSMNVRGAPVDYYGMFYHGRTFTHIDALCHIMWEGKTYNRRDPKEIITFDGASWGGVDAMKDGIITRAVLLDVPRFRGKPHITWDEPVHGSELEAIARKQGVAIEPGDAVCVMSGRDEYEKTNPPMGSQPKVPGLHASCLRFLRETDASVLLWDMLDREPPEPAYNLMFGVHLAIAVFGLPLVDNCALAPLAERCAATGRYDFTVFLSPLYVKGGTGSPINPIAVF